ncbi:MAG: hypothetical protein Q8R92_11820 [Deltaproteobacteria bacterium]|nr:hypothetical protein [Deltaproteobacteria bacterium]
MLLGRITPAIFLICAVLSLSPTLAHAVAGPDSVAVIANTHIDQSKALAAHYAAARQIPARQVCEINVPIPPYDPTPVPSGQYFSQKRTFLSVPEFRTYVVGGLEQCLGERALERIEAVVIARGVPLMVGISVGFGFQFPSLAATLSVWKSKTLNGEDLIDLRPMLVEPICDPASINCLARWRNPLKGAPEVFSPGWSGASISEEGVPFEGKPLMVTMLHGLSYGVDASGNPEVDPLGPATNLIDSALAAEAAGGASGKFLFMRSSDVYRGILDVEYEGIVGGLSQRGFTDAAIVDFSKTHTGETLASFFVGTADLGTYDPMGGSSTIEGNTYAPGALVDNLTSLGASPPNFPTN